MRAIKFKVDGVEYFLHAGNAAMFLFNEEKFNHLFIRKDDGNYVYVFASNETLQTIAGQRALQMHFIPDDPPPIDKEAHATLKTGHGVVYVTNGDTGEAVYHGVDFGDMEKEPITEEEVEKYAKEFQEGINWDELNPDAE